MQADVKEPICPRALSPQPATPTAPSASLSLTPQAASSIAKRAPYRLGRAILYKNVFRPAPAFYTKLLPVSVDVPPLLRSFICGMCGHDFAQAIRHASLGIKLAPGCALTPPCAESDAMQRVCGRCGILLSWIVPISQQNASESNSGSSPNTDIII